MITFIIGLGFQNFIITAYPLLNIIFCFSDDQDWHEIGTHNLWPMTWLVAHPML